MLLDWLCGRCGSDQTHNHSHIDRRPVFDYHPVSPAIQHPVSLFSVVVAYTRNICKLTVARAHNTHATMRTHSRLIQRVLPWATKPTRFEKTRWTWLRSDSILNWLLVPTTRFIHLSGFILLFRAAPVEFCASNNNQMISKCDWIRYHWSLYPIWIMLTNQLIEAVKGFKPFHIKY